MFTVFDLETTGFSAIVNDVIQFAYITYDENNFIVKAESLYFYYEGMSWSEDAYKVHHIDQEFLKQHADKFEENLVKMYATLMNGNVCGHNAKSFDCIFAANWLSRMGMPGMKYRCIQDTMLQLRPISKRPKIKLIKLAEMLGVTDELTRKYAVRVFGDDLANQAHNAAFDVMRTGIITVMGIQKNLISFSADGADNTVYSDEDLIAGDDTQIPKDHMLLRIRENNTIAPIVITGQSTCIRDVDSHYETLTHTTQCLEEIFDLEESTTTYDAYTIKKYQSVILFTMMKDGSGSCKLEIKLRESLPALDFYSHDNRDAFVNSFNSGVESEEWRFDDV